MKVLTESSERPVNLTGAEREVIDQLVRSARIALKQRPIPTMREAGRITNTDRLLCQILKKVREQ